MATDFDFDGSFEEEPDNENRANESVEEEAAPRRRSNSLLRILLLLIILVILCVVCYFGLPRLGVPIPGLPGAEPPAPQPTATEVSQLPPGEGEEPAQPGEGEQPAQPGEGEEPAQPGEGEEPAPGEEEQPVPGEGEEPAQPGEGEEPAQPGEGEEPAQPGEGEEPAQPGEGEQPEATTEPVPGPTSTPGPTVVVTITPDCDNNTPPTADANGPYDAMMGKGSAVVTLDGSGSSDAEGSVVEYAWDFGDGTDPEIGEAATVTHAYSAEGSYIVTLTVLDDCGATATTTTEVTVVGPTPPAEGTVTATPVMTGTPVATATPMPPPGQPAQATMGFCYMVQPGDTLFGIAHYYGVPLHDLARVNNVTTEYYVLYGQGLFIPTGPIMPGPNAYTAEAGDTIYSVAYQCGITAYHLARANNLDVNAALTPGQVLTIPIGYR